MSFLIFKKFVSLNLEWTRGNAPKEYADSTLSLLKRMFFYAFYQPYLFSLIVLYPDFERQLIERKEKPRNWQKVVFFVARVAFWWVLIELALHFLYFGVIVLDEKFAAQLPKDEFVSLGMAMGSLFRILSVV